jgi:L-ascorbate metabolism protein UlaG (beta-lactamase superfamily)
MSKSSRKHTGLPPVTRPTTPPGLATSAAILAVIAAVVSVACLLGLSLAPAYAGTTATPAPALGAASASPSGVLELAEGEGDVDESFNAHGADTDEEMETDSAKMPQDTTKSLTGGIRWFGQSAFLLHDGKNIYIDPFNLIDGLPSADIILITHDHYDHLSPNDIAKIAKPATVVVTVPSAVAKIPKELTVKTVKPGDTLTVEGVKIEAVPAYNLKKQFHPKDKGYVGFIVHFGGRTIYHAGDTDLIPEMKNFKVDVAMLPVGGTYTMTASEAAKAANIIKPKVAIPMHYGSIVGSAADAQTFKAEAKVPVVIMQPETKQANAPKPAKPGK